MTAKRLVIKRIFYSVIGICTVLTLSLPFLIPRLLDTDYLKDELSRYADATFGIHLKTEKINLDLWPVPTVIINDLALALPGSHHLAAQTTAIRLSIPDLLKGHIALERIRLNTVTLSASPTGNLPEDMVDPKSPEGIPEKSDILTMMPADMPPLTVVVENFQAEGLESADMMLKITPETRTLSGSITGSGFNPGRCPQTNRFLPSPFKGLALKRFDASLTWRPGNEIDVSISVPDLMMPISAPRFDILSAHDLAMTISCTPKAFTAEISPVRFRSPALTLGVGFSLDRLSNRTSLVFRGKDVIMDDVRDTALALFDSNAVCRELFTIIRGGLAPQVTVQFTSPSPSTLFDPETMVIRGNVKNARVQLPETNLIVSGITADARVEKGILHTTATKGIVEKAVLHKGRLSVALLTRHPEFDGLFDITADLATLPGVLRNLLPGTLLAEELAGIGSSQGTATGTLALVNRKGHLTVDVRAHDIRFKGDYSRIPGDLSLSAKLFVFDGKTISADGINGSLGRHRLVDIDGTVSIDDNPYLDLYSGKAIIDAGDLFDWVRAYPVIADFLAPLSHADGIFCLDSAAVSGPALKPEQWIYDVRGNGRDVSLGTTAAANEITSMACRLIATNQAVILSDVSAVLKSMNLVSVIADLPTLTDLAMPVSLSDSYLEIVRNKRFAMGKLSFKTGPRITFSTGQNAGTPKLERLSILHEGFSDALFVSAPEGNRLPFYMDGALDVTTVERLFNPGSSTMNRFNSLTQGSRFKVTSHGMNQYLLCAETLDLDALIARMQSPPEPGASQTSPEKKLNLDSIPPLGFDIGSLIFHGNTFSPFKGTLYVDTGSIHMSVDETTLCGLAAKGTLSRQIKGSGPPTIRISAMIDQESINLAQPIACLLSTTGLVDGTGTITGAFSSQGDLGTLYDNLEGTIDITGGPGRIHRLTLLSRILSVINVSQLIRGKLPDLNQEGFSYDSLVMTFTVAKRKILIKSAVIKGLDMTLIFRGWIDNASGTMDLVCLVAPFKSADIIIEKLPIIGTVMDGRLISIPVRASGAISDPDVSVMPVSEIGRGLSNTIERILNLPMELIGAQFEPGPPDDIVNPELFEVKEGK